MNIIFLLALIILAIVWINERSYSNALKKVQERWGRGDKSCELRKVWYGWRVIEYAEDKGE